MAELIKLDQFCNKNGNIGGIEKVIPFEIKRIFYIYDLEETAIRGKHKHHRLVEALLCICGECQVTSINECKNEVFYLNSPNQLLILSPDDYRVIHNFTHDTILIAFASTFYDKSDYIYHSAVKYENLSLEHQT
jgi:hypothetical protein